MKEEAIKEVAGSLGKPNRDADDYFVTLQLPGSGYWASGNHELNIVLVIINKDM